MSGETLASTLLSVANWLTYLAYLGLTGSVAGQLVILPRAARHEVDGDPAWPVVTRRLLGVATTAALLLLVASAARLYAQTYSVFGLDEPVTAELLELVALQSRWGGQWRPQAIVTVMAVCAVVSVRFLPRAGWWLCAFSVAGLAIAFPMTGHAMAHAGGVALAWTLQAGHIVAVGLWLGTLTAVFCAIVALRGTPGPDGQVAALVHAFSPVAIGAVSAVVVTGAWTTVLYLDGWNELWTTPWGRALLLKVVLVSATGAVGAYNWRKLRPRLGTSSVTGALMRSSRLELVLGGLVLVITAILVHLPMINQ